jgi:hypothetical protein
MTDPAQYSAAEERSVRDDLRAGKEARCPRDDAVMTLRSIGGGSFGLGYARSRRWLICPECKRSVIFDEKRGTRN